MEREPGEDFLDHFVPKCPGMLAGAFFVGQVEGQGLGVVVETEVVGVGVVFGAATLVDIALDFAFRNLSSQGEQVMLAAPARASSRNDNEYRCVIVSVR